MIFQPLTQFEATLYSVSLVTVSPNWFFILVFCDFLEPFSDLSFILWSINERLERCLFGQEMSILRYILEIFFTYLYFFSYYIISLICIYFFNIFKAIGFIWAFFGGTFISLDKFLLIGMVLPEMWFDTSINKFHVVVFFIACYLLIFFVFSFKNARVFFQNWNLTLFGFLDSFLTDTIVQQLGVKRGQKYAVFLKTVFLLILFSNIFGLIPFSFTITSHLIFTFALSVSILIGITCLGFYMQGVSFLKLLVPGGAPSVLLPLLVPLEFISYVARCFSLAIRLFANMMSGHTLLNILSGFVLIIGKNGFLLLALAPLFVVLAVSLLELGIAFLQAYVFLVLVCIYLKDAFEAGH